MPEDWREELAALSTLTFNARTDKFPARDQWHKADFDNLKKNPEVIKLKREEWVLNHDAEAHAYKTYPEAVASLRA